jgi:hypothetical protein
MKRLIMMLLLVALAIPATAFAGFGSSGHGTCTFTTNDRNKTITLNADCTTDTTIGVPDGYTLNGDGHKITAVDGPSGAFNGAVVENDGTVMHVRNLTIDGASTAVEQCNRVFNGVAFMYASGSIKNVTLTDIGLPETGCQIGRAILVHAIGSPNQQSVEISGNTVSSYNKNGIDVRGNVNATIIRNTVTGSASDRIARNGIVVRTDVVAGPSDEAFAEVWGNIVSGNSYLPAKVDACGILVIDATVNMSKKNTVTGNDANIWSEGIGGVTGKYSP